MATTQANLGFITLDGSLTTENALTVSYIGLDQKLPRTPHGEVLLNAGTIRGPLRKAAVRVIRREYAKAKGVSEVGLLSLTDDYMLGTGYDRSREVNNEKADGADPAAEVRLRAINPMLSLFGRWGLAGYLTTWEMRASEESVMMAGQGARADQYEREPSSVDYLSDSDKETLEKEIQANRAIQKRIDDEKKVLATMGREYRTAESDKDKKAVGKRMDKQKEVIAEIEQSREGGEHSIKHPLGGVEVISAGTTLSSGFELIQGKPVYLGLLLHTLNEFARNPHLGGHTSKGYGRVSGEYTVSAWSADTMQPEALGTVRFDKSGFHIEGDALQAAYDDFPAAIGDCRFDIHTLKALREYEQANDKQEA